MKKQQEIREGIYNIIEDRVMTKTIHTGGQIDELIDDILSSLHSQGVRIVKVTPGIYPIIEPLVEVCPQCGMEPHLCKCPTINRGSFAKYVED